MSLVCSTPHKETLGKSSDAKINLNDCIRKSIVRANTQDHDYSSRPINEETVLSSPLQAHTPPSSF
jgi:hypothetical protein